MWPANFLHRRVWLKTTALRLKFLCLDPHCSLLELYTAEAIINQSIDQKVNLYSASSLKKSQTRHLHISTLKQPCLKSTLELFPGNVTASGVSSRRWALKRESYENRSAVSVHVGQSDHRGQLNVCFYTMTQCVSRGNMDLSAGRSGLASLLYTCCEGGIIWLSAVVKLS